VAVWGLAGLVLAGAAAAWQAWHRGGPPWQPTVAPDRPPVAVLPFTDAREPSPAPLVGLGFAEELSVELARNAELPVIATTSVLAASDHRDDLRAVASRLNARYVVDGSLQREGESLRLRVRLVDGRDGQVAWTLAEDVPAAEVYRVRSELVERIATSLQSSVRTREKRLVLQRPPASLDSYEQALRGMALKHRITRDTNAEAKRLLDGVLQHDPEFAPAWAYLGMVEGMDWLNQFSGPRRPELLASAINRLERARELDPRLSASHLGLSFLLQYVGRHADAVTAGRRCLELAPSDAECRMFLAFALVYTGQTAEAATLAERAMALSPLAPGYMHTMHGVALWGAGRLEEAVQAQQRCLQLTPQFVVCRIRHMLALAELGRTDEALADLAALRAAGATEGLLQTQSYGMFAESAAPLVERGRSALRAVLGAATASR
jgi:adenylate cyclase